MKERRNSADTRWGKSNWGYGAEEAGTETAEPKKTKQKGFGRGESRTSFSLQGPAVWGTLNGTVLLSNDLAPGLAWPYLTCV